MTSPGEAAKAFGRELGRLQTHHFSGVDDLIQRLRKAEGPAPSEATLRRLKAGKVLPASRKWLPGFDEVFGADETVQLRRHFENCFAATDPSMATRTEPAFGAALITASTDELGRLTREVLLARGVVAESSDSAGADPVPNAARVDLVILGADLERDRQHKIVDALADDLPVFSMGKGTAAIGRLRTWLAEVSGGPDLRRWQRMNPGDYVTSENDWERTFELQDVRRSFRRSASNDETWDCTYWFRRVLKGNWDEGISTITQDFTRRSDEHLVYTRDGVAGFKIVDVNLDRTRVAMDPPRVASGAAFRQDIRFRPPVPRGQLIDITTTGEMTGSNAAFRESVQAASRSATDGTREFDYVSRVVAYPTRLFRYQVFLPDELGAKPLGFRITRFRVRQPVLEAWVTETNAYTEEPTTVDGVHGTVMRVEYANPPIRTTVRLLWLPPSKIGWHSPD